jgi:hypothetical protein
LPTPFRLNDPPVSAASLRPHRRASNLVSRVMRCGGDNAIFGLLP